MKRHPFRVNILQKKFTKSKIFYDTIRHLIRVNNLRKNFMKSNIFYDTYKHSML